jgi:hypothetical protein
VYHTRIHVFEPLPAKPVRAVAFLLGLVIGHHAARGGARPLGLSPGRRNGVPRRRVTLNPASHLDVARQPDAPNGGFGWGKPTPVMPAKLRGGVFGPVAVALAGPISNLVSWPSARQLFLRRLPGTPWLLTHTRGMVASTTRCCSSST